MACHYSELVYEAAREATEKRGHGIFDFDKTGRLLSKGFWSRLASSPREKRIGVDLGARTWIIDPTARVQERLEALLFPTGERLDDDSPEGKFKFSISMRIVISGNGEAVASAHWHVTKKPEDYFFTVFAEELEKRLERAARDHDGSIDQRITKFHKVWQEEIAETLSSKFKVDVELKFDVALEPETAPVIDVGCKSDAGFEVAFKDRIDKAYPFKATISLVGLGGAAADFPKTPDRQRTLLKGLIKGIMQEDFSLYDYWYRFDDFERNFRKRLSLALAPYGRSASEVAVERAPGAPALLEQTSTTCSWSDAYGEALPFHATGHVEIAQDGAGKYDRAGRPDRAAWFHKALDEELKLALAGRSVSTIEEHDLGPLKEKIRLGMSARAQALGLLIEPFIGNPALPYREWERTSFIEIEDKNYVTADPKISAGFSMAVSVEFKSRAALEPFLENARNDLDNEGVNARIENEIRQIAIGAAARTLKQTGPDEYFINFTKWNSPIPGLGAPVADRTGESKVESEIRRILKERHPLIGFKGVKFHRTDRCLENLRNQLKNISTLEIYVDMKDRLANNAAYDRRVEVTAFITGGDPERAVQMLHKGYDEMDGAVFKKTISDELRKEARNALFGADDYDFRSLISSSITDSVQARQLRQRIEQRLAGFLADKFGLVADVRLYAEATRLEEEIRDTGELALTAPLKVVQKDMKTLVEEYDLLADRHKEVLGNGPKEIAERSHIEERQQEILARLAERTSEVRGEKRASVGLHARDQVKLGRGGGEDAPEANKDSGTDASGDDVPPENQGF